MRRFEKTRSIAAGGTMALKFMSLQTILAIIVIEQIIVILLSTQGSLFPSADALASFLSCFASIIASLYGITLAGYTFFLSRIDGLTTSDTTLDFIVDSIKRRFKYLFWVIAFNVMVTLFTTMVLMYAPAPESRHMQFFYRLFCNEFMLSVAASILLILYYSILVINPNSIEKEAARLKKKLSPSGDHRGDINAFISTYSRIEAICNGMIPPVVLSQVHQNKGRRFSLTIQLLREQYPQLRGLLYDLARLHRYYECAVNCKTLSVSQEMCLLAQSLLTRMEEAAGQMICEP